MDEIFTVAELAVLFKMSKRQIYTMCETRTRTGSMKDHPLPMMRINGNLRFLKSEVMRWLNKEHKKQQPEREVFLPRQKMIGSSGKKQQICFD